MLHVRLMIFYLILVVFEQLHIHGVDQSTIGYLIR